MRHKVTKLRWDSAGILAKRGLSYPKPWKRGMAVFAKESRTTLGPGIRSAGF